MQRLILLLDFDGTLVDQHRDRAYWELVKKHAYKRSRKWAEKLYRRDLLLCSREMYDRECVFCKFKQYFPQKSIRKLCADFWEAVSTTQEVKPGCARALERLRDAGHTLCCATDTDGDGTDKLSRIRASGLLPYFKYVFVGSEDGVPAKGDPAYLKYILKALHTSRKRCVMIGDKPKSDLLPAREAGISSILVVNPEYPAKWCVKVTGPHRLPAVIRRLTTGVFLSYSHLDKKRVNGVATALRKQSINVWLDVRDVRGGDPLVAALAEAIRSIPVFVVVISHNSARSSWVKTEIDYALDAMLSQRRPRRKIIPVRIDDVRLRDVHPALINRYIIDFTKGRREGLSKLRKDVIQFYEPNGNT